MRTLVIFSALVAFTAGSPPTVGVSEDGNILTYYNEDGNLVVEDLNAPVTSLAVEMDKLHFMLYTVNDINNPYELKFNDLDNLANSPFDGSKPTKFLIHGWQGSYEGNTMQGVKDAWLGSFDVNVIMGDYKKYNSPYVSAVDNSETIACKFANFLDYLALNGLRLKDLHIIGHSLGAHISGFTANCMTSGTVPRITGMDPAGPLFGNKKDENKLSPQDATFVDILHTSTAYGMGKATGTADFYANGGGDQPDCREKDGGCDHIAACNYFAKSLVEPKSYPARKCKNEKEAKVSDPAKNQCEPSAAFMGEPALATAAPGIYYVATLKQ